MGWTHVTLNSLSVLFGDLFSEIFQRICYAFGDDTNKEATDEKKPIAGKMIIEINVVDWADIRRDCLLHIPHQCDTNEYDSGTCTPAHTLENFINSSFLARRNFSDDTANSYCDE